MKSMKFLLKAGVISAVIMFAMITAVAQERKITIFFTGHIVGNYEPCG